MTDEPKMIWQYLTPLPRRQMRCEAIAKSTGERCRHRAQYGLKPEGIGPSVRVVCTRHAYEEGLR